MDIADLREQLDPERLGEELHDLVRELFPLPRSITGDAVRATLDVVGRHTDLTVHEVPSGTPVLDWTVPKEWNLRGARVEGPGGLIVLDAADSNLHVVGYSLPVDEVVSLEELRARTHTLPDQPERVPYRTSYYQETWGLCMSARQLASLPEGEYRVRIDATLIDGSLTYGECLLPGATPDEVLLTAHVCHPSLANDNLSGIAVLALLGEQLARAERRYSYRLLFIPGTIGSITWLARNEANTGGIRHGIVLSGVGDPGPLSYKRSRRGDATVDRAAAHVLATSGQPHRVLDFSPYGYDERQFCSPGFDLPVGRLSRSPHGEYPEYHTSGDDLEFVRPGQLAGALVTLLTILDVLERDETCLNLAPKGEPQLGRRGLYGAIGGLPDQADTQMALLWVLNQSDGQASLLDIATRAGLPFAVIGRAARLLRDAGLLGPAGQAPPR